jgi:NADPH:quinone reductase-like Zn-dependent oxidoreductase
MPGLPYLTRVVVPTLGLRRPKVPVLGMDVAGRVEAVGQKVTRFQPGDEVFGWCDGSFAEYTSAPRSSWRPSRPTSRSSRRSSLSPVRRPPRVADVGAVQPGQQVLVIGAAGGVGSFGVQLAKALAPR